MSENLDLFQSFRLTSKESFALFSLQSRLTELDVGSCTDSELRHQKEEWLNLWNSQVFRKGFLGLFSESPAKTDAELLARLAKIQPTERLLLIVFEALIFVPYFNLQHRDGPKKEDILTDRSRDLWLENLDVILGADLRTKEILQSVKSVYKIFCEEIFILDDRKLIAWRAKKSLAIGAAAAILMATGGVAAPAIGGWIGGIMGLSGAAATSAGLAFLGGGAMAAGGLGMAGGTAAIIGGAGVLGGLAVGQAVGKPDLPRVLLRNHSAVLNQLARLNAILKSEVFGIEKTRAMVLQSIEAHLVSSETIESEISILSELDQSDKTIKSEIKSLKKVSGLYKNARRSLLKWIESQ